MTAEFRSRIPNSVPVHPFHSDTPHPDDRVGLREKMRRVIKGESPRPSSRSSPVAGTMTVFQSMLAAGCGAVVTSLCGMSFGNLDRSHSWIVTPLDTIKVRLQVQQETNVSAELRFKGTWVRVDSYLEPGFSCRFRMQ